MIFKTEVRVRFSETDLAGCVYHGNYFVYFEVGRSRMYHQLGHGYNEMRKEGIFLPVVEAHCEYECPAQYDDVLEVHTKITEVGEKSLRTEYEIYNKEGVLLVKGYCIQVCVDSERKARPFPGDMREVFVEVIEK